MPHRGRLNVLANIVGKPYSQIFSEFEGNLNPSQAHGSGDVKYHLGATGIYLQMFGDNDIQVSLTANPSHLEAVDPVLEGLVRAKQDLLDPEADNDGCEASFSVVPMMMHGDAAFAGQGVVAETLNLAQPARLPRRRHHPLHRQQPDRLHHRPGVLPVQRVLHRRRENDRGADLPRQRRRPGGLRVGGAAGRGLPAEVPEGRRHRHAVLPPARAQRGRRPVDDQPVHVRRRRHQARRLARPTPRP